MKILNKTILSSTLLGISLMIFSGCAVQAATETESKIAPKTVEAQKTEVKTTENIAATQTQAIPVSAKNASSITDKNQAPASIAPVAPKKEETPEEIELKKLQKETEAISMEKSLIQAKLRKASSERSTQLLAGDLEKTKLMAERDQKMNLLNEKLRNIEKEKMIAEKRLGVEQARANQRLTEKQSYLYELELKKREVGFLQEKLMTEYSTRFKQVEMDEKLSKVAVGSKPVYLKEPLVDGTLYISDRRIDFNGVVTMDLAEYVCSQIYFYNNQNSEYPIFIVIDSSPGGSVAAGYLIQKAMHSSKAPVYVVVKNFAASMAAVIATTAERSYCFKNTRILHHQISSGVEGNLTVMREGVKESEKWYENFGTPVAQKMGLSLKEFTRLMYEHNSNGDWVELGDGAVKWKWVDNLVSRIEETSVLSTASENTSAKMNVRVFNDSSIAEKIDTDGKQYFELPMLLNPLDCWWIYDPQKYYRAQ